MNKEIEFKKDCIMKTMVSEITDISLTHDYKVLDDVIDGYFDISGEYKVTKASMQREEFMYTIPFSIALSSLIDKNSINLTIKDFNYSVDKDVLHLKMLLNMDYKEMEIEEFIEPQVEEEIIEEEEMETVDEILESIEEVNEDTVFHNELMIEEEKKEEMIEDVKIDLEDKKEAEKSIENIISGMSEEESYYKYKVYIMREEDTIESVAIKYNVTLDDLREYNDIENISIGDKIVVPFININAED
jgi:LysM repeat protein